MSNAGWGIFLMGLLSEVQVRVIAFMDLSEFVSYILGPIFFMQDYRELKRHGFGKFLLVWFLCAVGCCVSSYVNETPFAFVVRGLGVPVSMFCLTCVFHRLLVRDFGAFKWFFLGAAISKIISVYIFQRGTSVISGGEMLSQTDAAANAIGYSLFWFAMLKTWLELPIDMNYLKTPKWYCVSFGAFLIGFGFLSAGSRSSLGVVAFSWLLVVVADKSWRGLSFMRRHFLAVFLLMAAFAPMAAGIYKYAAVHNYLGDKQYDKYMAQTKRGSDALSLLMAGRSETFIGLFACLDKPIVGHGPWAIDRNGYVLEWLKKWGAPEDFEIMSRIVADENRVGSAHLIPGHSFVITFWLWYGVFGLICMLYVGWIYLRTLKNNLGTVPELYGYFAFALPGVLWHWAFSPFGFRTKATFLLVLCVFTWAIEKRRFYFQSKLTLRG